MADDQRKHDDNDEQQEEEEEGEEEGEYKGYGERDPMKRQRCQFKGKNGGAYPEIRRWQYPLGMGKKGKGREFNARVCVCVYVS